MTGDEVGGEADPQPRPQALAPGERDDEQGDIVAAADGPVYRPPGRGEGPRIGGTQPRQQHIGVPRLDLGQALGGHPVRGRIVGTEMNDQCTGVAAETGDNAREFT